MKTLLVLFSATFLSTLMSGQTVTNSAGGAFSAGSFMLEFSIGEMSVQTYESQQYWLTEGVLQPVDPVEIVQTEMPGGTDLSLRVFPNPTTDWIKVETDYPKFETLEILSTDGQLVLSESWGTNEPISVSGLPQGIYFIRLSSKNIHKSVKFTKQ